ncbi:hypothetical protein D6789_01720 [Candidatus Woesearchaeota archaeon]|nr:MAG: hypothetical protein D6789_01720 [Candidatus Woesearchaeota archaeon]
MLVGDKRGISPLIATVLLMAFAVAIGGMIMNWSSNFDKTFQIGCGEVKLESVDFCRTETGVSIWVRNSGEQKIAGLTLKQFDSNDELLLSTDIPKTELPVDESLKKEVPITVAPSTRVGLYASIMKNNEPTVCADPVFPKATLPQCS